ncbi:GNAT family N-acetyltransferase [Sphingomonas sp. So64.6b]|uniref:GNAT family N-acetyltransferase n=1 Tax=Sphingomonas sp. So64.6b TaxID=2997354 RepID=UPI0015FF6C11|nr:GNAT family N-acetyltransferase [Sphingomonas sp. So64.6b]QNA85305.1 GNAT family N-acetyltransferase [Sphingomonas sp. So64.6b]
MSDAAILGTPRLILRRPIEADFADMFALWSDAQVLRFIGPPGNRQDVWARLLRYIGHWSLFGYGYWIVREADTGYFVGEAGIAYQRRADIPALDDDPEAGWALAASAQGHGYAGEALAAILAWADASLDAARTTCIIDPANAASVKLAMAQGYRRFASTELKGNDIDLFARPRGGA